MRTKLKGTRGCKNNSPLIPEAISIIKNNVNNDDKLSETNILNSPFFKTHYWSKDLSIRSYLSIIYFNFYLSLFFSNKKADNFKISMIMLDH